MLPVAVAHKAPGYIAGAPARYFNGSFGIAAGLLGGLENLWVVGLLEAFAICLKLVTAGGEVVSQPL